MLMNVMNIFKTVVRIVCVMERKTEPRRNLRTTVDLLSPQYNKISTHLKKLNLKIQIRINTWIYKELIQPDSQMDK